MSTQHNKQLGELQALVTQLGDAAASNERRTARLERTIRWGVLGGLGAVGIALAITVKPLNDAVAQQETLASTDVKSLVEALNGIKGSLDNLNVVGMMQGAAANQAKLEANKIVTEAPTVSREVVSADPKYQPKGPPMLVSCARMSRADDIAIRLLKARYPLGASALAYLCQQQHPSLVQKPGIDEAALENIEDKEYQQAVMAGTLRTMTNAAGLVNNLHGLTTVFGEMMQNIWAKMLEKTKKEVKAIVVTNELPNYCQMSDSRKAARLRIEYPLGAYALNYLCEYPGTTSLDEETLYTLWRDDRDEFQDALMQASADTIVDMGTLVFRLRQDSDNFRKFLLDPKTAIYLRDIRTQLDLLNRTLATVPVMSAQMETMRAHMGVMAYSMGSTAGRMGSMMPW